MSEDQTNPTPPSHNAPPGEIAAAAKAAAHTRRAFLFKLSLAMNAAVGAFLAVPLIGYLLGPAMKKPSETGAWIPLGKLSDFPVGETRLAAASPRTSYRSSPSTALIWAVRYAGSPSPSSSSAPAMAEPTMRTDDAPLVRPSADSSSTAQLWSATRC